MTDRLSTVKINILTKFQLLKAPLLQICHEKSFGWIPRIQPIFFLNCLNDWCFSTLKLFAKGGEPLRTTGNGGERLQIGGESMVPLVSWSKYSSKIAKKFKILKP